MNHSTIGMAMVESRQAPIDTQESLLASLGAGDNNVFTRSRLMLDMI